MLHGTCEKCGEKYRLMTGGQGGQCNDCLDEVSDEVRQSKKDAERLRIEEQNRQRMEFIRARNEAKRQKERAKKQSIEKKAENRLRAEAMILTTETSPNLLIVERLGIVSAEVVLGMNVFKDILADLRGTFGGRSNTLQTGLRDARNICLSELKMEAAELGADAVVGIDLDYHDLGTTGKMLMLVASGTAVKLDN